MTDDQYNEELASLLQQHQQNVEERKRLDQALIDLRNKRNNPTFADFDFSFTTYRLTTDDSNEIAEGHVKRD